MASASYIRKKRARASARGKYGNEVKRQFMTERAEEMRVVGTMTTTGSFGNHLIELLSCDEPGVVWLRVDGDIRSPRSANGIRRVLADWIWRKASSQ